MGRPRYGWRWSGGKISMKRDQYPTFIDWWVARNEALRAAKYLGRAIWQNWSGYHRRSRVETKMHCMKLLGQRLMARDFDRQIAEVQIRIAAMNGYTALGIPVTETVG